MADVMKNILGEHYELRTRKCTLNNALDIRRHGRKAKLRAKIRIKNEVNRVVDWIREVTIKTQSFIQYYVLKKCSDDEDILPGFFKSGSAYGIMQMVTGQAITNTTDPKIQNDRARIFMEYKNQFENPDDCTVPYLPGYSQCLAFMSETTATENTNAIVEPFSLRTEKYLAFRLRADLRHEVERNEREKKNNNKADKSNLAMPQQFTDEKDSLLYVYSSCKN
jgi:hypothetical protein